MTNNETPRRAVLVSAKQRDLMARSASRRVLPAAALVWMGIRAGVRLAKWRQMRRFAQGSAHQAAQRLSTQTRRGQAEIHPADDAPAGAGNAVVQVQVVSTRWIFRIHR